MNETYKIRNVGGSLMVVLPQHIVRAMNLNAGDEMVIQAFDVGRKHGMITVKPAKEKTPNGKGKVK